MGHWKESNAQSYLREEIGRNAILFMIDGRKDSISIIDDNFLNFAGTDRFELNRKNALKYLALVLLQLKLRHGTIPKL